MADQPAEQSKSALKKAEKMAKMEAAKAAKAAKTATLAVGQGKKTDDIIGMTTKKEEDFPNWYQEVVLKADMIEYYNEVSPNPPLVTNHTGDHTGVRTKTDVFCKISGFFIMRPASMYIWNVIRKWFQERIEGLGVEETSFPMFLSSKSLEKEKGRQSHLNKSRRYSMLTFR